MMLRAMWGLGVCGAVLVSGCLAVTDWSEEATGTYGVAEGLVADPTSMVLGAVASSVAADGTTAVVVTLMNADGTLFTGRDVQVSFTSNCAALGKVVLESSVTTVKGMAAAMYQPNGCTGADTVTASATTGTGTLRATATLRVSATGALSGKAAVGKRLFFDAALSASGQQSCASCHAPTLGFLSPSRRSVPQGGVSGLVDGFRTAPSAAYASLTPPFGYLSLTNKAGSVDNGANGKLGTPRRGLMWDGRASTVYDQAKGPFLGPHEMANANSAAVLTKLLTRPYLASFAAVYGAVNASSNPETVLTNMANAIAQYETEEKAFVPFSSKFDAVVAGRANFTAQEASGQALYLDNNKGACLGCHNSDSNNHSVQGPQMFTDLSYRVLAVPRNWSLPYNDDSAVTTALQNLALSSLLNGASLGAPNHKYYDLGFCGPFRTDALTEATLCGAFRVPSLRNVALKESYFHNGVYNSLEQVINFYMNRDLTPQQIYTQADGTPDIPYNDLPVIYRGNIEVRPPFATAPASPQLTSSEVQDLVTFLCTLTDGYDPQHPEAYRLPLQCRRAMRL